MCLLKKDCFLVTYPSYPLILSSSGSGQRQKVLVDDFSFTPAKMLFSKYIFALVH